MNDNACKRKFNKLNDWFGGNPHLQGRTMSHEPWGGQLRVGIVRGGWTPSFCLQTLIFEWKPALNFNPWAKFQTFRQVTPPPVLLGQFQHWGSYQLSHAYDCFLGTSITYCAKNWMKKCFHSSDEDFRPNVKVCNVFGRILMNFRLYKQKSGLHIKQRKTCEKFCEAGSFWRKGFVWRQWTRQTLSAKQLATSSQTSCHHRCEVHRMC